MSRPRVLMPVYNGIEYDGRVRRIAEAVSEVADVTVVSLATGREPAPDASYRVVTVDAAPRRERGARVRSHLRFWRGTLAQARALRPAVIHAHDYFMAFPGAAISRIVGARLVYDAHELIIPSSDESMGGRERVWYRLERLAIPHADLVIAANEERARFMRAHYELAELPLPIRNIPPVTPAPPHGAGGVRLAPRAHGVVRLVYQGDLALNRRVGEFIRAVAELGPGYEMVLLGSGPDVDALQALVTSLGVGDRVQLPGRVPSVELQGLLRECDLGVITYPATGLNNVYCAPNKLYEYAQAGLPMVALPNPVLDAAFAAYGVGISDADPAAAISRAAAALPALRAALPGFVAAHQWSAEAARLQDAYRRILG